MGTCTVSQQVGALAEQQFVDMKALVGVAGSDLRTQRIL